MPDEGTQNEFEVTLDVYPAINAAFEFVLPRYQMSMQRFDAALTRVVQVGTFVPAAFFPAVALVAAAAEAPDYTTPWFFVAVSFAVLSTLSAWGARLVFSTLLMPDLTKVHAKMLHLSEARFKADMVAIAGQAADAAAVTVDRLYSATLIAMVCFGISAFALTVWATQQI